MFVRRSLLLTGMSLATGLAWSQPRPPVIALVSAIGDQIDLVRQRPSTGSHLEPYSRRKLAINGQALNYAVLRGLNRAIGEAEPLAQRVLLRWSMPADTTTAVEAAPAHQREAIVLAALTGYLQALPERAQWDRIEVIVPSYFQADIKGMGRKLVGLGIYVQPLANTRVLFDDNGEMEVIDSEAEGDHRTVNPNGGETAAASTYVAPYMYFQRLTLDARTLAVLARKKQFDNTKYKDPNASALDVSQQMPLATMVGKLLEVAERSAYTSVRGKVSEVKASEPVEILDRAPADRR